MIHQARTYLVGAVSATSLIAAAIVVFIAFVSLQALKDWPLTGLAEGDSGAAAVSAAHPAKPKAAIGLGVGAAAAPGPTTKAGHRSGGDPQSVAGLISPASGSPTASAPSAKSPAPASHSPSAGGESQSIPDGSSGGSSSAGGGSGGATKPSGSQGGGESGGGSSPSETVTNTVNETVQGVDEATGGALGETGVTEAVEGVVEKAAGPESIVGQTVDKTVEGVRETVGGLLGPGR